MEQHLGRLHGQLEQQRLTGTEQHELQLAAAALAALHEEEQAQHAAALAAAGRDDNAAGQTLQLRRLLICRPQAAASWMCQHCRFPPEWRDAEQLVQAAGGDWRVRIQMGIRPAPLSVEEREREQQQPPRWQTRVLGHDAGVIQYLVDRYTGEPLEDLPLNVIPILASGRLLDLPWAAQVLVFRSWGRPPVRYLDGSVAGPMASRDHGGPGPGGPKAQTLSGRDGSGAVLVPPLPRPILDGAHHGRP